MNTGCPKCWKFMEDVCETDTYGFPLVEESAIAGIECPRCKAKLALSFKAILLVKEA